MFFEFLSEDRTINLLEMKFPTILLLTTVNIESSGFKFFEYKKRNSIIIIYLYTQARIFIGNRNLAQDIAFNVRCILLVSILQSKVPGCKRQIQ